MVVIAVILLILMIIASCLHRDHFTDAQSRTIVYTKQMPNVKIWLTSINEKWTRKSLEHDGWNVLREHLLEARAPSSSVLQNHDSLLLCMDPYEYDIHWENKQYPVVHQSPEGYFVSLYSLPTAFTTECSYNLAGKRIGFITETERLFINAILLAHRIDKNSVQLVQLSTEDVLKLDKILDKHIDVFITYIIPNSLYFSVIRTLPVSLMGWQNIDIDRIRVFHPYIQRRKDVDIKALFTSGGSNMKVLAREEKSVMLGLRMNLYLAYGRNPSGRVENFITRIDRSEDLDDPAYQCYGDLTISQPAVCNSTYDVSGVPKTNQTVWDRPCFTNEECPFFQSNQNYSNNHGGCVRGRCELPVGIQRKSYRHYVDTHPYTPICYQCIDPNNPNCCEDQKNRKLYPKLKSPDYAFENDQEQRRQAKLPHFVSAV